MERVSRFVLVHRRVIAALLVAAAVWSALMALTRDPDTRPVAVAAHDLSGGATVRPDQVEVRRWPAAAVPKSLIDPADVDGRVVVGGMRAGEPFTDRRAVDPRDLGAGRVLAVVEVPAAVGVVVRGGDAVDVLAVGDDGAGTTVAESADVIAVRRDQDRDVTVLGLAVERRTAADVARLAVTSRLTAVVSDRR